MRLKGKCISSPNAVAVIPLRGNEFLMVKNPKRGWEFPGGKIERDESVEQAALRECREEAGAVIDNLIELGVERDTVFFTAIVVKLLNLHEFERRFLKELPDELAFPRDEAEKYLERAFKTLGSNDVMKGKL